MQPKLQYKKTPPEPSWTEHQITNEVATVSVFESKPSQDLQSQPIEKMQASPLTKQTQRLLL